MPKTTFTWTLPKMLRCTLGEIFGNQCLRGCLPELRGFGSAWHTYQHYVHVCFMQSLQGSHAKKEDGLWRVKTWWAVCATWAEWFQVKNRKHSLYILEAYRPQTKQFRASSHASIYRWQSLQCWLSLLLRIRPMPITAAQRCRQFELFLEQASCGCEQWESRHTVRDSIHSHHNLPVQVARCRRRLFLASGNFKVFNTDFKGNKIPFFLYMACPKLHSLDLSPKMLRCFLAWNVLIVFIFYSNGNKVTGMPYCETLLEKYVIRCKEHRPKLKMSHSTPNLAGLVLSEVNRLRELTQRAVCACT